MGSGANSTEGPKQGSAMEIIRLELSGNRGKDGGTRGKEGVKGKWGEIIWDYRARLAGADVTSMRSEWESDYKWKGVSNASPAASFL